MIHRACHRRVRFVHEASREGRRYVQRGFCPGCHHWIEKDYWDRKEEKVGNKHTGGDCYAVHARALIDGTEEGLLCHGTVYHPETGRHGHCWIERDQDFPLKGSEENLRLTLCRDIANGKDVLWPRDLYYHVGQVEDVKRYTRDQAAILMLESGNHGPWNKTEERAARRRVKKAVKKVVNT